MKQEAVISGRDGELASAIMENLRKTSNFESFGIYVLAIETKQIDLPDENKSAVYERMISERENIAASYAAEGRRAGQGDPQRCRQVGRYHDLRRQGAGRKSSRPRARRNICVS